MNVWVPLRLRRVMMALCVCAVATTCMASGAETKEPKPPVQDALATAKAKPLGPEVEVMFKDGNSRRGQLLSYANGLVTVALESGEKIVKDGTEVASVHFVAKPQLPSALATELSIVEMSKLMEFRKDERKNTLSREEEAEFKRLRAKAGIHIDALEREIPDCATESDAREKIQELLRYYGHYGVQLADLKMAVRQAVASIKSDTVRKSTESFVPGMFMRLEDRLRPKKFDTKPTPTNPNGNPAK